MIGLSLWLAVAASAAAPVMPRTGPVSALIHSETFKRPLGDNTRTFRVDYTASLVWALADRKVCFFNRCRPVCDMTISHKVLSRRLWLTPPGKPAMLAQDDPSEREYAGGLLTFGGACASVSAQDVAHGAADRLRPYQFADELIKDRSLLLKAADTYLALNPPTP